MPGIGMLLFTFYLYQLTGGVWFAWARSHEAWGRSYEGLGPILAFAERLSNESFLDLIVNNPFNAINAAGVMFALALTYPVFRKLGSGLGRARPHQPVAAASRRRIHFDGTPDVDALPIVSGAGCVVVSARGCRLGGGVWHRAGRCGGALLYVARAFLSLRWGTEDRNKLRHGDSETRIC